MLLSNSGGSSSKTYIDDLFSIQLRTGNGSTQSITTGFQPDLIWTKSRSATTGHRLVDSTRGAGNSLESNSTLQQQSEATGITAFSSSGYSLGADSDYNTSGAAYVDWCWKKAPKFFDVVTYTGNGVGGRQIPHSLGVAPGMIVVKRTSGATNWSVYHRSLSAAKVAYLNLTDQAYSDDSEWNNVEPTTSVFTVGNSYNTNANGASYVAYLFAHDPSADGIIQCGSFTGNTTVNIGWEPQWIMIKRTDAAGDWIVIDSMRGCSVGGVDAVLNPNLGTAESVSNDYIDFTATGFITKNLTGTYIYTVIRRPNKPPTSGTEVFSPVVFTAVDGLTTAGFPVDTAIEFENIATSNLQYFSSRLTAPRALNSRSTAAETTEVQKWDSMTQVQLSNQGNSYKRLYCMFRRAPGFFDVVCYTGTGVARTVPHGLGVAPELMIVKGRSANVAWYVYAQPIGATKHMNLNSTNPPDTYGTWDNTTPTDSVFSLGPWAVVNTTSASYVAYLFASLPGISKVGSYTGNGSSQTINCGFAAGARFILIRRTDSTGDWYVWSSATGIVAANDPHLSLNTTAAEVTTDDSVDPDSTGFIVNQVAATNINVTSASYIYLAIA